MRSSDGQMYRSFLKIIFFQCSNIYCRCYCIETLLELNIITQFSCVVLKNPKQQSILKRKITSIWNTCMCFLIHIYLEDFTKWNWWYFMTEHSISVCCEKWSIYILFAHRIHEPVYVSTKGLSNILYVRNICILQLLYMVFQNLNVLLFLF